MTVLLLFVVFLIFSLFFLQIIYNIFFKIYLRGKEKKGGYFLLFFWGGLASLPQAKRMEWFKTG